MSYFTGTIAYSDDFVNSDADSLYYELAGEFPIGETGFNITGTVGYSDVEEATDDNYTSYQVGVNYSWNNILLDVSYFDTSSYGAGLQDFLGPATWADSRVVFTASYEF